MTADDPASDSERGANRPKVGQVALECEGAVDSLRATASALVPSDHRTIVVEQCGERSQVVPHAGATVTENKRDTRSVAGHLDPQLDPIIGFDHLHGQEDGSRPSPRSVGRSSGVEADAPDRLTISCLPCRAQAGPLVQPSGGVVVGMKGEFESRDTSSTAPLDRRPHGLQPDTTPLVFHVDGEVPDLGGLFRIRECEHGNDRSISSDETQRLPPATSWLYVRLRQDHESYRLVIGHERQLFVAHPNLERSAPVRAVQWHQILRRLCAHRCVVHHQQMRGQLNAGLNGAKGRDELETHGHRRCRVVEG